MWLSSIQHTSNKTYQTLTTTNRAAQYFTNKLRKRPPPPYQHDLLSLDKKLIQLATLLELLG